MKEKFAMLSRILVDHECMPIIAEHFDKGTFPMEMIARMASMELFGGHVDGYGCRSRSHMEYGLICRELGRCDSGLRAMFSVQNSLVMFPIYKFGSEEQREKWLPKMAQGEIIGCFGLSEPDFGSDPAGMITTARRTGGHYVLDGQKMWITNGTIADMAVIWAKLEGEVRGFIKSGLTSRPGFRSTSIQRKFSYRTSSTAFIELKNCEIPQTNILPSAVWAEYRLSMFESCPLRRGLRGAWILHGLLSDSQRFCRQTCRCLTGRWPPTSLCRINWPVC